MCVCLFACLASLVVAGGEAVGAPHGPDGHAPPTGDSVSLLVQPELEGDRVSPDPVDGGCRLAPVLLLLLDLLAPLGGDGGCGSGSRDGADAAGPIEPN